MPMQCMAYPTDKLAKSYMIFAIELFVALIGLPTQGAILSKAAKAGNKCCYLKQIHGQFYRLFWEKNSANVNTAKPSINNALLWR